MFPSIMAPKIPILVSQCEMDHQKPTILLIFSILSLGDCGGHHMRPELDLKDKSQMSRPNEYTDNFQSISICIFTSVRAKSKKTLCPRTQCNYVNMYNQLMLIHGIKEIFLEMFKKQSLNPVTETQFSDISGIGTHFFRKSKMYP